MAELSSRVTQPALVVSTLALSSKLLSKALLFTSRDDSDSRNISIGGSDSKVKNQTNGNSNSKAKSAINISVDSDKKKIYNPTAGQKRIRQLRFFESAGLVSELKEAEAGQRCSFKVTAQQIRGLLTVVNLAREKFEQTKDVVDLLSPQTLLEHFCALEDYEKCLALCRFCPHLCKRFIFTLIAELFDTHAEIQQELGERGSEKAVIALNKRFDRVAYQLSLLVERHDTDDANKRRIVKAQLYLQTKRQVVIESSELAAIADDFGERHPFKAVGYLTRFGAREVN